MRKLLGLFIALALVALLVGYAIWIGDRPVGHYLSDLRIHLVVNEGQPGERGNLLGIQPELFPADYQSTERLHRKLSAYLQQARDQGLINSKTIVVLPEHIGTWLLASGERNQLYQAQTIQEAMTWLALSHPWRFINAVFKAKGGNRLDDAHMRMKAEAMARDYQSLFGGLAREFGVTLVAGSIVLPEPSVENGQLQIGNGPLFNSSVTFGSDGLPIGQPQRQLSPANHQRGYIRPADGAPLHVIDTPAGRLGVLIGSDSWYPRNYKVLNQQGVELIAIPALVIGNDRWNKPWGGSHHPMTVSSIGFNPLQVSEGLAWQRLTLSGREYQSNARASISVFMRGQLWDQGSSGYSFASHAGQNVSEPLPDSQAAHGARLINIWL
jgi:predicted amidohydrolase